MNKYKFGDKVYISTIDMEGKIIGWEYKVINGKEIDVKYTVEIALEDENVIASNVPEKDLEPIRYNGCDRDCRDCWGHNACSDSNYNDENCICNNNCNENDNDFENELDDDEIEDYRYNKSCESLDNDKKFNLGDLYVTPALPQIVDYIYNEEKATTVLKWSDGTTTKATVQMGDKPDKLTGFAYAVAKKYYGGNDFFAEADYWLIRKPRREKALVEKLKQDAENELKREEKRKRNRERRIIRAKTLDRSREYEVRKLAAEKYGVPMEWNEDSE